MAVGSPTYYKPEYIDRMIEFFNREAYEAVTIKHGDREKVELVPAKFPTLTRFATSLGVCRDTLYQWANVKDSSGNLKHPEFADAYKKAKDYQASILVEGAMSGVFNPAFSIFTAKNLMGWKDKQEIEHTGKDGGAIQTENIGDIEIARRIAFLLTAGAEAVESEEAKLYERANND